MRITRLLVSCVAITLAAPAAAGAQDAPKAGVVIGFPTALGIIWHASDRVAVRPEISVGGSSSDRTSSSFNSHSSSWGVGFGLGVLFYTHTEEHLRTYIVPRFFYHHMSATNEGSGFATSKSTAVTRTVGGVGGIFYP